jgi:alpha-galactosidase
MLPFQDRWQVKLALLDAYGYLPAAGDRHLAEFFPYFLPDGRGPSFDVLPTTVEHRLTIRDAARAQVRRWVDGTDPPPLERSEEEVADIVAAVAAGRVHRAVVNLPNAGQVDNLPRGAVVETLGTIGPTGAHGIAVGALPPGVLGTVLPHALNQALIVEAAMTGDRSLALQALLNDPLTRDLRTAPRLLDDLLEAHAAHLPRFFA